MNSHNTVILQTALHPLTLVWYSEDGSASLTRFTTFSELFDALQEVVISNDTELYINRGPGSYAGIRTGISFAFGLLHGGKLPVQNIFTYTSFDLVVTQSDNRSAYIKGLPRIATHSFVNSKGYYQAESGEISYIPHDELPKDFSGTRYAEEKITDTPGGIDSSILADISTYEKLLAKKESLSHDLTPLYVNPVHITTAK